jgi:hypothetical protein
MNTDAEAVRYWNKKTHSSHGMLQYRNKSMSNWERDVSTILFTMVLSGPKQGVWRNLSPNLDLIHWNRLLSKEIRESTWLISRERERDLHKGFKLDFTAHGTVRYLSEFGLCPMFPIFSKNYAWAKSFAAIFVVNLYVYNKRVCSVWLNIKSSDIMKFSLHKLF